MKIQNTTSGASGVTLRLNDLYAPENFKDVHGPGHPVVIDPTEEIELQDDWRALKSRTEGQIKIEETAGTLAVTDEPVTSSDVKAKVNEIAAAVGGITPLP